MKENTNIYRLNFVKNFIFYFMLCNLKFGTFPLSVFLEKCQKNFQNLKKYLKMPTNITILLL